MDHQPRESSVGKRRSAVTFSSAAYSIPELEILEVHEHNKGSEKACSKETHSTLINPAFSKLL